MEKIKSFNELKDGNYFIVGDKESNQVYKVIDDKPRTSDEYIDLKDNIIHLTQDIKIKEITSETEGLFGEVLTWELPRKSHYIEPRDIKLIEHKYSIWLDDGLPGYSLEVWKLKEEEVFARKI